MHCDSCPLDYKVYVGNLGNNGNNTELERAFGYYGPLRKCMGCSKPSRLCFVEFEDPRDAADAVRELDGRTLCDCRVRVELSNGEKRSQNRGPPPSWGRRPLPLGVVVLSLLGSSSSPSWGRRPLPLGVVVLEMITAGGVLHLGADPQGEAFPKAGAGHFLEMGE